MTTYFRVSMPGQPPSWNHMYGERGIWEFDPIQRKQVMRRRRFVLPDVATYRAQLTMLTRVARPSDFQPSDKVLVAYVLFVSNDIDGDNVMKACNDAIAKGLGINDRRFISMVLDKYTGSKDPRVEVAIYDADHWQAQIIER